jgi:hypothetical protein
MSFPLTVWWSMPFLAFQTDCVAVLDDYGEGWGFER